MSTVFTYKIQRKPTNRIPSWWILGLWTLVLSMLISGHAWAQCGSDPGNSDIETASPIAGCFQRSYCLDFVDDIDVYRIDPQFPADMVFETLGSTDTFMELLTSFGEVLEQDDDDGEGHNAKITHHVYGGATYYVKVRGYSDYTTGAYDLRISGCCGADPYNNDFYNTTPFSGALMSANIDCPGDADIYRFTATEAGRYTFAFNTSNPIVWAFYDSERVQLTSYSNDSTREIDLGAGEDFYIVVEGFYSDTTGSYTLQLTGFVGTQGCGDDPGNDAMASATDLGSSCGITYAEIDCEGDEDYYRFTAPSSDSYNFYTVGGVDTYINLLDQSGGFLTSDDDSGQDANASVTYSLTQGSIYYIVINEYGNNATGGYHLYVSGCPTGCGDDPGNDEIGSATALVGCGTIQAAIDCAGDDDYYVFQAPADSTYTWSLSPTNRGGMILYAADGTTETDVGQNTVSATMISGDTVYLWVSAQTVGDTFNYDLELSGCSGGGCGSDPGNDNLAAATDLGSSCGITYAEIDCEGDEDYYRFTAPSSDSYNFYTVGGVDTYINLLDQSGGFLTSDDDSGQDANASVTYSLTQGSIYYIVINEYGNNATGGYHLYVSGCPTGCGDDPGNDEIGSATALAGCGTTHAAIDCVGDDDYYSFQATADSTYTWSLSPTNRGGLLLYAADGTTEIDAGQNTVSTTMSSGDTVYLWVSAQTVGDTFNYDLELSGCSGGGCGSDPGNDNLAAATALSGCGSTPAAIDCAGDLDYYWLTAPNSGSFTFETTGSTDTMLKLYNASGDLIADDDDSGDAHNAKITASLVSGQKYSVAVNEYNNDDTGSYTLVISGCGQAGCGNDPGDDSFGTAGVLPGCVTTWADFDCVGDEDYYSFMPTTDGSYTITLQVAFNALVELYDSNHNLVAQDNAEIVRNLQSASGPYFVVVLSPLDLTGSYDLTINGCDVGGCSGDHDGDMIGSATILSGCGSTAAAFDCIGDVDYFELVAPISGDYTFETTGAMDTKMWLQDSQGGDMAFDDDSGQGQNAAITATLQSGISYFVRVEEYNNDETGSYGLMVAGCNAPSCGSDTEGDTISDAVSLSTCGVIDAEIDCNDDVDVFRFEAPLSVTYTFETLGSLDTFVRLLDGNGNQLAADDDSGTGANARFSHSMAAGEAVYLEVVKQSGAVGAYQLAIDGCEATGEPPNEFRYIVPAIAKIAGSEGTNWVSDLAILNLGLSNAGITISRWERDRSNTNPQEISRTLGPGQLERSTDVLLSLFGQSEGAAALQIRSDQPLVIGSRTYNTVNQKTYGQYVPGVEQQEAISSGEEVFLAGLAEDGDFRTNLGLVNPGASEIHVTGTFFDSSAQQLGSRTWTVPAHGYIQRNRVLRELSSAQMHSVWARLTVDSGEFFSFLSIIDQQSGDPVYRPGRTSNPLARDILVPGVAKLGGAAGTNWVTDASFTNTTTDDAAVKVSLWNRDGDNSNPTQRSFLLQADQMAEISDVLFSLFGESGGAAALQVAVDPGILADGRTYNQVKEGTYGQNIPGLGEGSAVTAHRNGYLVMPAQNAGFRANLGLLNPSQTPVDVEVRLFDADGAQVGSARTWRLASRAVIQIDRIVRQFTAQDFNSGWLEISVKNSTPAGKVHVFESVVDEVSGDPIFETVTLGS